MPFVTIDPVNGDVRMVMPGNGRIVFHNPTPNIEPAINDLQRQGANVCVIYEGKSKTISSDQRGVDGKGIHM